MATRYVKAVSSILIIGMATTSVEAFTKKEVRQIQAIVKQQVARNIRPGPPGPPGPQGPAGGIDPLNNPDNWVIGHVFPGGVIDGEHSHNLGSDIRFVEQGGFYCMTDVPTHGAMVTPDLVEGKTMHANVFVLPADNLQMECQVFVVISDQNGTRSAGGFQVILY